MSTNETTRARDHFDSTDVQRLQEMLYALQHRSNTPLCDDDEIICVETAMQQIGDAYEQLRWAGLFD